MGLLDLTVKNTIELNMIPGSRSPRLHCSRYDVGREVTLNLYNGDSEVTPATYYCTIEGGNANFGFVYSLTRDLSGAINGNVVTFNIVAGMTAHSGEIPCEFVMYSSSGGSRIGSLNFILDVEDSPVPETATDNSTDFSGIMDSLTTALTGLNTANNNIRSATAVVSVAADRIVSYQLNGSTLYITANPDDR